MSVVVQDQPANLYKRSGARRRLRLLLAAGVLVIAAAAAFINFYLYLPEGSGPAGPAVAAEPFAKPWTDRKVLLVGIGDSVTAGFGASKGRSYFERLVRNPPDEFSDMRGRSLSFVLPNLETLDISLSGSNSLQHVAHIQERLAEQPDDVLGLIVMTSGGNDLIHWYGRTPPREGAMYGCTLQQAQPWIKNYAARLDEMFTLIEERFPGGCLIFIADIYDPSDGYGNPQSAGLPAWPDCVAVHTAYNDTLRATAAKHPTVRVVPMHACFLGHGVHCRKFWTRHYQASDPHYWYAFNLEDPNDRGYDAIRRLFLNEIVAERNAIAATR